MGLLPKGYALEFFQDTLGDTDKVFEKISDFVTRGEGFNFLFFQYEAIRLFSEVWTEILKTHKLELASWVEILDIALIKGEIKSELSPELLARMFT